MRSSIPRKMDRFQSDADQASMLLGSGLSELLYNGVRIQKSYHFSCSTQPYTRRAFLSQSWARRLSAPIVGSAVVGRTPRSVPALAAMVLEALPVLLGIVKTRCRVTSVTSPLRGPDLNLWRIGTY